MNKKMENPVTFLNNTTAALTEMDELIPKELQMPVGIAVSKQRGCVSGRRWFHCGDLVLFFLSYSHHGMYVARNRRSSSTTILDWRVRDRHHSGSHQVLRREEGGGKGSPIRSVDHRSVVHITRKIEIGRCDKQRNTHTGKDRNGYDTSRTTIGTPRQKKRRLGKHSPTFKKRIMNGRDIDKIQKQCSREFD